ncbi:hypothetical protein niasHS_009751 [Heterodera schachtii]|uniref:Uncharacterized protein n=1 Tax=Heterodera schachtii TaxID=97005 RepID=A0ABD2J568_HETSC
MSRKFSFILYEYLFREYVAEYVKAVDPAMAEHIPVVEKPIIAFQYREMEYSISITFCEAISDWANIRISVQNGLVKDRIWQNYDKTFIQNEQSLTKNYALNFNRCYEPEYLFDMKKLKLKSNANAKFNNSFAPLRRIFDHKMEKMKTEAMAKLVPMLRFDLRRQHVFKQPFYGIDKAVTSHCGLTPQFDTVRPNFKFGHNGSIESLLAVLYRLGTIWAFFFDPSYAKEYGNKLDALFKQWPEPLLINETEVSAGKTFDQKVIGIVHQIGKSPTKKGKGKVDEESSSAAEQEAFVINRANFENLIKQNYETVKTLMEQNSAYKVNRIYEWLFSTTANRQQEVPKAQTETAEQIDDDYVLVPKSQTEMAEPLDDDDMLIAFVTKDYANFEQYCMEMEKQDMLMHVGLLSKRNGKGEYDIGETVRYLLQQYEAYFGAMYLLTRKWKCEKIDAVITKKECNKFKSYLKVLYEFVFIKYLEANNPSLAQQFATIERPKFQLGTKKNATIIDVLDSLCPIWAFFFDYDYGKKYGNSLEALFKVSVKPIFIDNQPIWHKIMNVFQKIKNYNMKKSSDDSEVAESSSNETIGKQQIAQNVKIAEDAKNDEYEELLNETLIEKGKKLEENTAKIEMARKAFDNLLKSMTETAKMQSGEGFGKNKLVLRWLFQ